MDLTIEQKLKQGISLHREGNLQEAERIYRAILENQPAHPDANHNLGVLAVSMNKTDLALPLFKLALDENPKIEQFWLSYIGALIKEKHFEDASEVLKHCNKAGFAGEKLDVLKAQLISVADGKVPSEDQLNRLLEHYQNSRFADAEKLAISMTQQFPEHQFGWKVLGAVLKQTGRRSESLVASQKSLKLAPQDVEAHNNLGTTQRELGKFNEAEASFRQAIALKSDYIEAHVNLGITLKEMGRLDDAESNLIKAITLQPNYAEAHGILGAILLKLVRLEEAEIRFRQAIFLKADYAEAYSNLGVTLKKQGRLEEAEVTYRQAITLKADYAETHSNLGVVLQELLKLDEAEASFRQAIVLKPDYSQAYYNLGVLLKQQGRLKEAEASYKQAIVLKPDYAQAHGNLGVTLIEMDRLKEAELTFRKAIVLKSNFTEAILNLATVLDYLNNIDEAIDQLKNVLRIDNHHYGLRAGVRLAIFKFLEDDPVESKSYLLAASKITEKKSLEFISDNIYRDYLLAILDWHEVKNCDRYIYNDDKKIFVIGESHALVSHGLHVQDSNSNFLCKSFLIMGCQQWHLGNSSENKYKAKFDKIIRSLPKASDILLAIGEIDCRLDSGIIKHNNKFSEKDVKNIIITTVENYLNYVHRKNYDYKHNIIIQGVPCPNIDKEDIPEDQRTELIDVIREFNVELKIKSKEKGFRFLDVHKLTDNGYGLSNCFWHIDTVHLSPEGMQEAWRKYLCN